MDKNTPNLIIDKEFKNLIRPLMKQEYMQLEANILADGCRDPIITWQGIIIDGHNRYEICTRNNIPFQVMEMEFECREAVIAWICANQLGRRNITEETRKYLIGVQYDTEKIVASKRNVQGHNQHSAAEDTPLPYEEFDPSVSAERGRQRHKTAQRIAAENHISHNTVQKYAIYSRALKTIGEKHPPMLPKILSGKYKMSHENVIELSRRSAEEIRKADRRIGSNQDPFAQYSTTRKAIEKPPKKHNPPAPKPQGPSIKDMPAFDPDAEVAGLTLTIPSWVGSIERTRTKANLSIVSVQARDKLMDALISLIDKASEMLETIKEN